MHTCETYRVAERVTKNFVLLVACLLFTMPAAGQFEQETRNVTKRGTTAADFLNIPVGARATAMGSAVSATIDGPTSIYWNPAALGGQSKSALSVEYAQWLTGIDFSFVALTVPTKLGTVGLGLTSMRTADMEVTTVAQQNGTGETFNATSYALAVSLGRQLTDRFSIGASGKLINETIWNSKSNGVAFDIGTLFTTPFRGVRLGASISNFGTKMQLGGDDLLVIVDVDPNNGGNNESSRALLRTDRYDLPLTMRIGLASDIVNKKNSRVTITVDALNPNNSQQYVNAGAEIGLAGDLIQLRGGYSELFLEDNTRSLTLGAGLRYRFAPLDLAVDYAFERQEYFDGVNRFTLSVHF